MIDSKDNSNTGSSNNGNITFQYKEIYDIDLIEDHGATVGVEAPDKNSGTQYLFNYSYHANADTLKNGLTIRFSDSCDGEIPVSWCDCDGNPETKFSKDELLTTLTIYWVTETATSAARYYYEGRHSPTPPSRQRAAPRRRRSSRRLGAPRASLSSRTRR